MLNRLLKLETKLNNEHHWAYKSLHFFLDRLNYQCWRQYGQELLHFKSPGLPEKYIGFEPNAGALLPQLID